LVCVEIEERCKCLAPEELPVGSWVRAHAPSCPKGGSTSACPGKSWYRIKIKYCEWGYMTWLAITDIACDNPAYCEPKTPTPVPTPHQQACQFYYGTDWLDWTTCVGNWRLVARARIPGLDIKGLPYPGLVHENSLFLFNYRHQDWNYANGSVDDWDPWSWKYSPQVCDGRPDGTKCFPEWRNYTIALRWIKAENTPPQKVKWDEWPWGNPHESAVAGNIANHTYVTASAGKGCRDGAGRESYCIEVNSYWVPVLKYEVYHNDCVEWGEIPRCCECPASEIGINNCGECYTPGGSPGRNCPLAYCKKRACEAAGNCSNPDDVSGWAKQEKEWIIDLRRYGLPYPWKEYWQTYPYPVREVQDVITKP
ncbi:MAG: hypothetical protein QW687_05310, partial [Candidatus Hadarchaeales archaeon]